MRSFLEHAGISPYVQSTRKGGEISILMEVASRNFLGDEEEFDRSSNSNCSELGDAFSVDL